jgi:hypothetical protein
MTSIRQRGFPEKATKLSTSLEQLDNQQGRYMNLDGQYFALGVCQNRMILSESLLNN